MKRLACLLVVASASTFAAVDTGRVRPAIEKSIALLQNAGKRWFDLRPCTSCHHSVLPTLALMAARERGVAINADLARAHLQKAFSYLTDLDQSVQGWDTTDSAMNDTYGLWATNAAGLPPNVATAALVRMIATRQTRDGDWRTLDYRPPQTGSHFTTTALAVRAMRSYLPAKLAAETEQRVDRARRWLESTRPRSTEDRAFQLLGLKWAGGVESLRKTLAEKVIAEQRVDGGWAQLPTRSSDAYATGESLFALIEGGGIPVSHDAIQRGLEYLLKTQHADGSWLVESRIHDNAPVSPPYFETGFPHGKNQFTSCSGTSWAVMALALALPAANAKPFSLQELVPPAPAAWVETALFGSAGELKSIDPNGKTAKGTTALMMAAGDPQKVRLLIERGADVNARAKTGYSALMAASAYGGSVDVVRMLLDKGATIRPPAGTKVLFNGSALMLAVISGDLEKVKLLVERGADVRQKSIVFSQFTTSPLPMAVFYNDKTTVELLAAKGANIQEADADGVTPLGGAALSGHADVVELLARLGADVNHVDKRGMTPLIWASTIEFGNAETVKKLLAAGARAAKRGKGGVTAVAQAKKYGSSEAVAALEQSRAK